MKILFISNLNGQNSNGMSWSVPASVSAQSGIDDVLWINHTYAKMDHWVNNPFFHSREEINQMSLANIAIINKDFKRPDLVVFEGVYYAKYVKFAAELRKAAIPYVIIPRSSLTKQALHNGKYFKKAIANILLFNKFTKNALAIQYLTQKEFDDSGDRWNKKHIIVPNGFNPILSDSNKVFSNKGIKATFIGRLDIYQKGLDLLIEACNCIKTELRNANFTLDIYGSNWNNSLSHLTELVSYYNLNDLINICGEIIGEEKKECLFKTDLFVMTSRFEGMPMGLIEALAYSLPVLVTDGTNFVDEVNTYDAGWTCSTDSNSIKKSLLDIINSTNKFAEKSRKAKELSKQYNWNNIALLFHNEIDRLFSCN